MHPAIRWDGLVNPTVLSLWGVSTYVFEVVCLWRKCDVITPDGRHCATEKFGSYKLETVLLCLSLRTRHFSVTADVRNTEIFGHPVETITWCWATYCRMIAGTYVATLSATWTRFDGGHPIGAPAFARALVFALSQRTCDVLVVCVLKAAKTACEGAIQLWAFSDW